MSDEWAEAAAWLRRQQVETPSPTAAQRDAHYKLRLRQEGEAVRAVLAFQRSMEAAKQAAVIALETLMRDRGMAAQQLLGAQTPPARIVFGTLKYGDVRYSVYLNEEGIRIAPVTNGPHTESRYGNVREAVEAFAEGGEGNNDPAEIRHIADWLTRQVQSFMPASIPRSQVVFVMMTPDLVVERQWGIRYPRVFEVLDYMSTHKQCWQRGSYTCYGYGHTDPPVVPDVVPGKNGGQLPLAARHAVLVDSRYLANLLSPVAQGNDLTAELCEAAYQNSSAVFAYYFE